MGAYLVKIGDFEYVLIANDNITVEMIKNDIKRALEWFDESEDDTPFIEALLNMGYDVYPFYGVIKIK